MSGKTILFAILILAFSSPAFGQGHVELWANIKDSRAACRYGTNEGNKDINFKDKKSLCINDEAKLMELYGVFQRGTKIILYDSPEGKRSDDWFEVEFMSDMINVRYVIPTFEKSYRDIFIRATYHKKNGLDGKVSRMEVRLPR